MWDRWSDDSDSCVAAARLSLDQVLQLGALDLPGDSAGPGSSQTFLLQLALDADSAEAAVQPAGRAALLQVCVHAGGGGGHAGAAGAGKLRQEDGGGMPLPCCISPLP